SRSTFVPLFLWGRNHAASRRAIGEQGQNDINLMVLTNSKGSMVRMADRAR
ncbi:uncharacterized protein K441DRAFT_653886, partial [Cenococcum geophilum 1.58]|uniref:uncharacterized protein n=1 Tax=Cenococcum geophilum 1.58 TaxID=794803 RepID=UPI00358E1358